MPLSTNTSHTAPVRTYSSMHDDPSPDMVGASRAITDFEIFVTADEAFPALERSFLNAENHVSASFRIFDLNTRLRSAEALSIGADWFDLVVHTLQRGVAVRMVLADFDPVAAPDLHRATWRSIRQFAAAREMACRDAKLTVIAALHPARVGLAPRIAFEPLVRYRVHKLVKRLRDMTPARRAAFVKDAPGLRGPPNGAPDFRSGHRELTPLTPTTHHQKMAVFDGRSLYIGGLDLNERRFDTRAHDRSANRTWHDVQCLCRGPVVAAASAHLDSFLAVTAGERPPLPRATGFLRTLSVRRNRNWTQIGPRRASNEIEMAHARGVAEARHLVYLETQFFRHVPLARTLARRARLCPSLRLIVLLPGAPEDVAFDNSDSGDARLGEYLQARCFSILKAAFGDRLLVVSPVQPRRAASDGRDTLANGPLIYVHSKVSIFDSSRAIVSSANLNGRSLHWDTEAGIELTGAEQVAHVRAAVMGAWLPDDPEGRETSVSTIFDEWSWRATHNAALSPEDRMGLIVPYDVSAARHFGTPVPIVPDEMV